MIQYNIKNSGSCNKPVGSGFNFEDKEIESDLRDAGERKRHSKEHRF